MTPILSLCASAVLVAPVLAYPDPALYAPKTAAEPSPSPEIILPALSGSPVAFAALTTSTRTRLPAPQAITATASPALLAAMVAQPAHRTVAPDPWEKLNRFSFNLNNSTDRLFFKPLARGYRRITFGKFRKAMRNLLNHLDSAGTFVNDILQGQFKRAANTGGRFIINSAIGFGGVADPAARLGIPDHSEDFGQTLAVWGVPSGPYVVLPFFGPSTVRDSFGLGVDSLFLSPLNYVRTGAAQKARLSQAGMRLVALREPLLEPLEEIERNSLDYYSSFRSFYLQARRRDILNGESVLEDLPDLESGDGFDDFDDFDDFEG
ncbi:MAG: VacJ family lipoprotein [Pseudomonadota bacterium]